MSSLSTLENRSVSDLADIRSSILLFLQDPEQPFDLEPTLETLSDLEQLARSSGGTATAALASEAAFMLKSMSFTNRSASSATLRTLLDHIVKIEAQLIDDELGNDLFDNVSQFVDESFQHLTGQQAVEETPEAGEAFEIDEETLEIFRSEVSELVAVMSADLDTLTTNAGSQDALWEMRRAVHTLKGAAGIVGLDQASKLAHRIEDLLGLLVDNNSGASPAMVDVLRGCVGYFSSMTESADVDIAEIDRALDSIIDQANSPSDNGDLTERAAPSPGDTADAPKPPPAPIVRVALDRLRELQNIAHELAVTRTTTAEMFESLLPSVSAAPDRDSIAKMQSLLARQLVHCNELLEKIEEIRLVRFGTLSPRLNRAVNLTCQEEGKKAEVVVENEDVELDTQVMDSLVEPLLHLLRNAVVHGIEPPETRRMIAKAERGRITVRAAYTPEGVIVSVADNGRGISAAKLKEKAVATGSISPEMAESMTDREATELIFLRGVTTAETLSMNAGRGIGMSIVKESIESRGGKLTILTRPGKGSKFTMTFPVEASQPVTSAVDPERVAELPVAATEPHSMEAAQPLYKPIPSPMTEGDSADAVCQYDPPQLPVAEPVKRDKIIVLVVDDSMLMRNTVTKVIERAGWTAITAVDGRDAIKVLKTGNDKPDLIVTDLEMPNVDGLTLIRELKRSTDFRHIPVVMVTSRAERIHREKALSSGAARFFTKPFEGTELKSAINELCSISEVAG